MCGIYGGATLYGGQVQARGLQREADKGGNRSFQLQRQEFNSGIADCEVTGRWETYGGAP